MAQEQEDKTPEGHKTQETATAGPGQQSEQQSEAQDARTQGDGFAQIRAHHQQLRALLGECSGLSDQAQAGALLGRLGDAWGRHARAHDPLYDAAVEAGLQEFPLLTELAIEADLVSFLLMRAPRDLDGPLALAALRVAARLIGEIIEREEKPRTGLLVKAKAAGVDPEALGRRVRACTTAPSGQDGETKPQLRHLTANQEDIMPRNSNMPERDQRGRFVSDDDDGRRGGGGRRGRQDDDRERDSRGRFMSDRDDDRGGSRARRDDDDDRRYSRGRDDDRDYGRSSRRYDDDRRSQSRRYDDDDDRGYSRGRGHGGWFGDPEGHSEASRRGWEHRRDDDDDRYSSRGRSSRRYDDDDDRGYSRDRGQGGWFGDPEGHSEASRRGWEHRRDDDDDDRYSSRGRSSRRYDDDDRSYSRGRGQGGWFGDPEGHSEASRRGWEHRRDDDDDDRYSSRGRR